MSTVAAATTMTGKHFIGGQWRRQQRASLESHNPAHWDEIIGVFPAGGAEEANQAVVAARAAFPGWRHTSRIHRAAESCAGSIPAVVRTQVWPAVSDR